MFNWIKAKSSGIQKSVHQQQGVSILNIFNRKAFAKKEDKHAEDSSSKSQIPDKQNLNTNKNEQELNNYGHELLRSKKDSQAREVFRKLISIYPDYPGGYAGLAMIAQKKKDWKAALNHWDTCLEKNTEEVPSWWLVKKAFTLIELKQFKEAEKLFETSLEIEPDEEWAYKGLIQVAQELGDNKMEIQRWETLFKKNPDYPTGRFRYGKLLRDTGRYEEAEICFQQILTNNPESKDVLEALAWTAREIREYDLAVERWKDLIRRFPRIIQYKIMFVRTLLDTLAFDLAQAYYDQHLKDQPGIACQLLQADIYWFQLEVERALDVINKLLVSHPNERSIMMKKVGFLFSLHRSRYNSDYASQALRDLKKFWDKNPQDEHVKERIIDAYLLLNQKEDALLLIDQLPVYRNRKTMEFHAWSAYMNGDTDRAKSIHKDIQRLHHVPQVQTPSPKLPQRTDTNPMNISQDSILVFTVVRNERWRLPWFLEYYRSQGVDHFFFVDNDSTDGTTAYLHQQKDVYVFHTNQSYAKAYSGMQWINWLVEQYGQDCWCMYVDVDEALIYPGVEKRSLKDLTHYLNDKGQEAMYAFMLDMYAPGLKSLPKDENYTGFLTDYPLFENQYFWINSLICPYRYTAGGIRRKFRIYENQTKTPIIRGGCGIKFLMSSHHVTPAIISDVTGVLLHYKLAGDFEHSFAQDLVNNSRMAHCNRRHWGYIQTLQNLPSGESFLSEHTVSYSSSQQLVDLDLIQTSYDFEAGNYD